MYNDKVLSARFSVQASRLLLFMLTAILVFASVLAGDAGAFGPSNTKAQVPALCYECHAKLKEELSNSYVHFPFKQGQCLSCHNAHAAIQKGLLNDEVNALCLSCHESIRNLMKKENVHAAVKNGICTDCHYAHSGKNKNLLVKDEKEICWNCHEGLKDQLKKPVVHSPFMEGKCSSCHNAHASAEDNQLVYAANKVCKTCHAPGCKAAGVSLSSATKDMDCVSCHAGHSSEEKGLLGPYGHADFLAKKCEMCHQPFAVNKPVTTKLPVKELCLSCHKLDSTRLNDQDVHAGEGKKACVMCHTPHASGVKKYLVREEGLCQTCHQNTLKHITLMQKTLKRLKCAPVRDRKCFACHVPPHSREKLYLKEDVNSMCSNCHASQHKISHPLGAGVIDPRNGQPITCISCHSMHTAKAEFMLSFDRKRQLCIQCHKK
jgi:predicted CXXCH cytochrome family protein